MRYGQKRIEDESQKPEIKLVLDRIDDAFVYVKKTKSKPTPISKEHYRIMLDNETEPMYRAVYLIGLNCAMRQTDMADIRMSDIDLKAKTLSKVRHKSGTIRGAILWDRTVQAIREYLETKKVESKYLFSNDARKGNKFNPSFIPNHWADQRTELRIPQSVKFEHNRDACRTITTLAGIPEAQINVLMGHPITGMGDNYTAKYPEMTTKAVQAIEEYYFGKK